MFNHFDKRIGQVDTELQNFANAVRPLGSSVGLISSAYHLRARLQQVLFLFRENAANTFKEKVSSDRPEPIKPFSSRKKSKKRRLRATHHTLRPRAPLESDLEKFPEQFELLAKDLLSFLHFLHDIPEFTDEGLNSVVLALEADLKYWASCLKEFEGTTSSFCNPTFGSLSLGQFKFHAVGRYINNLTKEMDGHLEEIRDALRIFVKVGKQIIFG
jgi:WD repeat-containing protein 26